jgi:predicted Rossmann fold nucleotide-binding protein DprA/Smf involved in DNA uptake
MHDYQFDVISRVADLPLFRATNPATSRATAAEAKKFRSQHHRQILDALAAGPAGASGIAARCGMVAHQIGKRLHELAKAGRIVETGRVVRSASGRGEREWRCA